MSDKNLVLSEKGKAAIRGYILGIRQNAGIQKFADVDALGTITSPTKTHETLLNLIISQDITGFLSKINSPMVNHTKGELLYAGMDAHVMKRSAPPATPREPTVVASADARNYELFSVEADMMFSWDKIDAFAHFPNFQETLRNLLALRIAEDRIYLGWNGVDNTATATTAQILNVNKGWIQHTRDDRLANVISEIIVGSAKIFIGGQKVVVLDTGVAVTDTGGGTTGLPAAAHGLQTGAQILVQGTTSQNGLYLVLAASTANVIHITKAYVAEADVGGGTATQEPDYKNLDELVADLGASIPVQKRTGLTAMIADNIWTEKKTAQYKAVASTPSEKAMIEASNADLAGKPIEVIPLMPANTLVLTKHRNLSMYIHENWNRNVVNSDEKMGVVFWNQFREGYYVEDYDSIMVAENVFFA